ncbi:AAA family ATPase [Bradyrhizobium sp. DASA03120]|uniref:AAA family ATPase n=1 Tax=Bradyrhizobium sp. SMVTL-02 TaxID=3395917 RepID=UPI003F6E8EA2
MTNIIDFNFAKRQDEPITGSIDAEDIRERLHADARRFVEWLYSGRAFISRNEARVGDVYGTPGASMSIKLTGADAGLWKDHATDEGGDLIALYRAFMGYHGNADFVQSLKEIAKEYFGDPVDVERPNWRPTAADRIAQSKEKLGTKPREDLVELGPPVATYKYYDTRGNIIASVVRYQPDGTRENKTFRPYCFKRIDGVQKWVMGAPDLRPLYRLPEIAIAKEIVLVEGEGCADALAQLGIEATSAMQGAKAPIDKTDWGPLAGKRVTIWPDADEPGLVYARSVAARLQALGCTVLGITPPPEASEGWDAVDAIAEGRNVQDIIAGATPLDVKSEAPRQRINIQNYREMERSAATPIAWLISNIITEGGLSVLWGKSGSMKSFVALDMSLCIATGLAWHGNEVKKGTVIYVAAEGGFGLKRRAIGWRKTRGRELSDPDFHLIDHSIALTSDDLNELIKKILEKELQPVLIVLDTLARTFGAGDENKQADMGAYVQASDKLREATGANIMIIHHSGVHEDKRERGSNALRGAADTMIKIARKDHKIDVINKAPEGKQKDAEEFKTVKLEARKVAFETQDDQGEIIEQSTLILALRDDADVLGNEPVEDDGEPAAKLGKNQKVILEALQKAGKPLGSNRLKGITGLKDNVLHAALGRLVENGFLIVEKSGNHQEWRLADA